MNPYYPNGVKESDIDGIGEPMQCDSPLRCAVHGQELITEFGKEDIFGRQRCTPVMVQAETDFKKLLEGNDETN